MLAATAEGVDLARLLLDLLIVLLAAKLAAEVAERLRVPAVIGEICAGILIGPSVLGLVELTGDRGTSIAAMAEIGVLLLLLQVGMEMDIGELREVGRSSMLVALIGVGAPFVGGAVAGVAMGESGNTSIFLGAALTATSVGITARVFGDLRALATTEARVVLGAAVADDVLGLVILTVVVKVVTGGSVGLGTVAGTLGLALGFLLFTGVVGLVFVPRLLDVIHRRASSSATVVVVAFVVALAFAELADVAKLAFIIGAFMAGLALGTSEHHERVSRDFGAIGNIFIPVFFVQIGIHADIGAMTQPSVLGLAAVLTAVGIIGKLVAAFGAYGTRTDKLVIGLGMIPRGEVGLIFASIGLANGVLDADLYGALLVVVLVTTLMTPPLLRLRIGQNLSQLSVDGESGAAVPVGGWLEVAGDRVRLRSIPPVSETVPISLHVAELLGAARPSDELLTWFGEHRLAELTWEAADTEALLRLLRSPDTRAWRFLEVTAVLERALPEVAAAMVHKRADMWDLDPLGSLRFPTVEGVRAMSPDAGDDDELLLGAFAVDICADTAGTQCAVDLMVRLGRFSDADRIAALVADARLVRHGAGRLHAFEQPELLQLATHFASTGHARRVFILARAMGDLPTWQLEALDERQRLITQALEHPDLTGVGASNLAGARLRAAERLATEPAVVERLRHASISYLLTHDPAELARQAQLVEPLPRAGTVRVAVSPDPEADHWTVDVACRDTPGLLGHLAATLVDEGLDVVGASISTWPDGAVLDSFRCRRSTRPSARDLAQAMESGLRTQLRSNVVHGLTLQFDNSSLPWHTVCVVTGDHQPGALQAVTAAFGKARIMIHSATVSSTNGAIADRFALTDAMGRKLDDAAIERARAALVGSGERRRIARLVGLR